MDEKEIKEVRKRLLQKKLEILQTKLETLTLIITFPSRVADEFYLYERRNDGPAKIEDRNRHRK